MTGRLADEAVTPARRPWTADEIRALGSRTDLKTAGRVFGMGQTKAYDLARRGEFPAKVLKIGARKIVLVSSILRVLELDDGATPPDMEPAAATTAGPTEQQNADSPSGSRRPSDQLRPGDPQSNGRSSPPLDVNHARHLRGL